MTRVANTQLSIKGGVIQTEVVDGNTKNYIVTWDESCRGHL